MADVKTYYLAVYNPDTKVVEYERSLLETALVVDEVPDYPDKTAPLLPFERNRYEMTAIGRGLPWALYCDTVAFSWDNVSPKEAEE